MSIRSNSLTVNPERTNIENISITQINRELLFSEILNDIITIDRIRSFFFIVETKLFRVNSYWWYWVTECVMRRLVFLMIEKSIQGYKWIKHEYDHAPICILVWKKERGDRWFTTIFSPYDLPLAKFHIHDVRLKASHKSSIRFMSLVSCHLYIDVFFQI